MAHASPLAFLCLDEEPACIVVFTGSWSTLFAPTHTHNPCMASKSGTPSIECVASSLLTNLGANGLVFVVLTGGPGVRLHHGLQPLGEGARHYHLCQGSVFVPLAIHVPTLAVTFYLVTHQHGGLMMYVG